MVARASREPLLSSAPMRRGAATPVRRSLGDASPRCRSRRGPGLLARSSRPAAVLRPSAMCRRGDVVVELARAVAMLAQERRERTPLPRGWWRATAAPSCTHLRSSRVELLACGWCRRRVSVPRAHDRVCSLRLPPSRSARPCCGRRLEGFRLEARDPRHLPRSRLSHGTLRSSSLAGSDTSRRRRRPSSCGRRTSLITYDHAGAAGTAAAASALAEEASERVSHGVWLRVASRHFKWLCICTSLANPLFG